MIVIISYLMWTFENKTLFHFFQLDPIIAQQISHRVQLQLATLQAIT